MGQAVILLGTLEQQSVFAEMVTMVGCVDLHGVISNAGILRRGTDPADSIVDHRDHAAGQRPRLLRLACRHRHRIARTLTERRIFRAVPLGDLT